MIGHPASEGPYQVGAGAGRGLWWRRALRISLTGRLFLLVTIAVLPALVIQAVNEYYLRLAHTDDIRKQVVQTTDQFGEEIGELREGARQLLLTLAQLDAVKLRQSENCNLLFAKLKAQTMRCSAQQIPKAGFFAPAETTRLKWSSIDRFSSAPWRRMGWRLEITGPIRPPAKR
jgi:hypothetical protein